MARHKLQKSLFRPVWNPLRSRHYREKPAGFRKSIPYSKYKLKLLKQMGDLRSCPFSFSADTNRWFNRCPEQLVIGLKSFHGDMFAELGHQIRVPRNLETGDLYEEPKKDPTMSEIDEILAEPDIFQKKSKRKPDLYKQHTKTWRYNLTNTSHARAFTNLLHYSTAYAAGAAQHGTFGHLYNLDVGDKQELARWPITGLWYYDEKARKSCQAANGQEILEVIGKPGELPTKPKILTRPRPYGTNERRAKHYAEILQAAKEKEKAAELWESTWADIRSLFNRMAYMYRVECRVEGCEHERGTVEYAGVEIHDKYLCGAVKIQQQMHEVYHKTKRAVKKLQKSGRRYPATRLLALYMKVIRKAKRDMDKLVGKRINNNKKIIKARIKENYLDNLDDIITRRARCRRDTRAHSVDNFVAMVFDNHILPSNFPLHKYDREFNWTKIKATPDREIPTTPVVQSRIKRNKKVAPSKEMHLPRFYYERLAGIVEKAAPGETQDLINKIDKLFHHKIGQFKKDAADKRERNKYLLIDVNEWDRRKAHYDKQLKEANSVRLEMRVRRTGTDSKGNEVTAYFVNFMTELDIPLRAAEGISRNFASWWREVFHQYQKNGNVLNPTASESNLYQRRRHREIALIGSKGRAPYYSTYDNANGQNAEYEEEGYIKWRHSEYRQMCWNPQNVAKFLHPQKVDHLLKPQAEHGLFLRAWTDDIDRSSDDYDLRLSLWEDGLLRWNPQWSVPERQAKVDLERLKTAAELNSEQVALAFVVFAAIHLRKVSKWRGKISFHEAGTFTYRSVFSSDISSRGPPA